MVISNLRADPDAPGGPLPYKLEPAARVPNSGGIPAAVADDILRGIASLLQ